MLEPLASIVITGLLIFGNLLNVLVGFSARVEKLSSDESRERDLIV